ncbi:MAG: PQQ-binding-like beta-propeller repeat protein [Polyangiales bacterium]
MSRWLAVWVLGVGLLGACGDDDGGPSDASVSLRPPLDPLAPWPKFRANAAQTGRVSFEATDDGSEPWVFRTGKGVFSTPVIDGEGNVYVGSADRRFYALAPDGTLRWQVETGEIIDSSALLDDRGRVYFGSGDGLLRALNRTNGDVVWTFEADDASTTGGFISWFEGNVGMTADGTLIAPNDNFCTYAIDRDTGARRWCFPTLDQTWSLPALDVATGRLFVGNNYLLGDNVFAIDPANGRELWGEATGGSVAASVALVGRGTETLAVVGSFDGFVRAYATEDGREVWSRGVRDHVYASAGVLSDGTIVQPAADGTVYALRPEDGSVVWSFDTREPIRSSPAIDGQDRIYVGSGEGRLFVIEPDGRLRWSMRLIDEDRDDLNASPALGPRGVVVAGENGGVFFVPYDYCLRPAADARCDTSGGEDLPDDSVLVGLTTRFGRVLDASSAMVEANDPLSFSLFVREGGDTALAFFDVDDLRVTVEPNVATVVDVSGDRRFFTVFRNPARGRRRPVDRSSCESRGATS